MQILNISPGQDSDTFVPGLGMGEEDYVNLLLPDFISDSTRRMA